MISAFHWLVKITGYPWQLIMMRKRIYYEDRSRQGRRIKGSAIVISNHTTAFDVAAIAFLFPLRTVRFVAAELMYEKNAFLSLFLKCMGSIRVDRNANDYSFVSRCCKILRKGGVVEIYPEARLPLSGEARPLPFKPSAVFIALESGAPIIPVYNTGNYYKKERNELIIGAPIDVRELYDSDLSHSENLTRISEILRQKVIWLEKELERQSCSREIPFLII